MAILEQPIREVLDLKNHINGEWVESKSLIFSSAEHMASSGRFPLEMEHALPIFKRHWRTQNRIVYQYYELDKWAFSFLLNHYGRLLDFDFFLDTV